MGFLDDLKKDVEQARLDGERSKSDEEMREAIYRELLRPGMLTLHKYLLDLVRQLESLPWKVETEFEFPGIGTVAGLEQQDYRVYIDSTETPKQINLSFVCKAKETARHACKLEDDDTMQKFLRAQNVEVETWRKRLPGGKSFVLCEAQLAVTCNMRFEVNVETSTVEVELTHFKNTASQRLSLNQQTIDDETWRNNLGGFILRKLESLESKRLLDEEEKAKIQAQLADLRKKQEQAEREIETAAKIGATERAETASKRVNVLRKLQARLLEQIEQG